ncbi:H-NS histone family protein [Lysobacter sp. SG-8]|uniref:H-NS histone family protein n=1 Tax=Marilutibacter penaei TaxID=2759900 RepID=A0A7W3U3L1_9GAMM|nr:H-NS histone family protein [Lysobacter penaei]MBB1087985.1 H-NS histone family protein [Lysobacter penaei]
MTIDLNALSQKELNALITQAKKRKTTLAKRKPIASVRRKVTALAKAEGYTVEELFGSKRATGAAPRAASPRKGRKTGKVAPKYRDPANSANTWTGRGKQPRWLAAYTAEGRNADDFLIVK